MNGSQLSVVSGQSYKVQTVVKLVLFVLLIELVSIN